MLDNLVLDLIGPRLRQHPVFSQKYDEVFSFILKPINKLFEDQPDLISSLNLETWLKTTIFQKSDQEIQEDFSGFKLLPNTLCGGLINEGETYIRCIDCEMPGKDHIFISFCLPCYGKSNHDGHRIFMVNNDDPRPTTCTCGDEYYMKPENFCQDHQPQPYDVGEVLRKFPQDILSRCREIFPKVFYVVVSLLEISKSAESQTIQENIHNFAYQVLDETLGFFSRCFSTLNQAFMLVFGMIFKDHFKTPYNNVWHNCDSLEGENYDTYGEYPHACKCTILGALLRFMNTFDHEKQSNLHKTLLAYSKEASFGQFCGVELIKHAFYLFGSDYAYDGGEDLVNSKFIGLMTEYNCREDIHIKVLDSGYFLNILKILRNAISDSHTVTWGLYHIVSKIRWALSSFLDSKFESTKKLLTETNFLKELTDILGDFQIKFLYERERHNNLHSEEVYRRTNLGLQIERSICRILITAIEVICNEYPPATKTRLLRDFLEFWNVKFQKSNAVLDKALENGAISFNFGLERIFSFTLAKYLQEKLMQGIEESIKEIIPQFESTEIGITILLHSLKALGTMKYLETKDVHYDRKPHEVYFSSFKIFGADIFSIQLMSSVLSSLKEQLFDIFIENFFACNQEILNFFFKLEPIHNDDDTKLKMSLIDKFLNFLIFMMNDEICLFNLTIKNALENENPRSQDVIEKTYTNILLGFNWIELSNLKAFSQNLLDEEYNVDTIFNKIAIINQRTQRIKIKEEYYCDFDPYIFCHKPLIQANIKHGFASKVKKDQSIDLISGKFYKDLPEYLKSFQKNLYQSKLPAFLSLFITKFPEGAILLIRPVLKLILFNLQVADEAFKTNDISSKILMDKIKENYLIPNFTDALNRISQLEDLRDCSLCIKKIQKLICDLSSGKASIIDQNHGNQENNKEELSKKALFASKISKAKDQKYFVEEIKVEETITHGKIKMCQYCLKEIELSKDIYGIPIYIAFTNNMYDIEQKEFIYHSMNDYGLETFWPVVSSCHHFFHKECFEIVLKDSRGNDDQASVLFINEYETYCPLCKTFCNYFICIDDGVPTDSHRKTAKGMEKDHTEIYGPLSQGVISISLPIIEDMNEELFEFTADLIFERAYSYFLEGFHLNSQPKEMQKSFISYSYFFMAMRRDLETIIQEEDAMEVPISFLHAVDEFRKRKNIDLHAIQCEPVLNTLLFNILKEKIDSDFSNHLHITKKHLKILKEYLIFKLVQALSFEKESKVLQIKDMKEFLKGNQAFVNSIIKDLIFPIQKIVLASCMNETVLSHHLVGSDRLWNIFYRTGQENCEYLEILLRMLEPSITLSFLLEEIYNEIETRKNSEINLLNTLLASKGQIQIKRPRVIKLAPMIIKLPQNYGDFVDKYFKIKCKRCGDFNQIWDNAICLICGMVMCEARCRMDSPCGNLNYHAKTYHMGLGLFLGVKYLGQILISSPLNSDFVVKHPYIDKFGRSIQWVIQEVEYNYSAGRVIDFKNYTLSQQFLDYIKDIIYHHDMAKEAFKLQISLNAYYENGQF